MRIGINGFGRIGKSFVRAMLAQGAPIELVAVNDVTSTENHAHLLKFDSIQGRLDVDVHADGDTLVIGAQRVKDY